MFMWRKAKVTAAMILAAGGTAAQAQQACWQAYEVQAARVRDLQTLLMVGALKCSGPGYDVAGHYNNFVTKNRSALAGYNDVLKVRFMREEGIRAGQRAYDQFTTALANVHSDSAQATETGFCQMASTLVALAGGATADDLEALAENIAERPRGVGETCSAPGAAAAIASLPPKLPVAALAPDAASVADAPPALAAVTAEQALPVAAVVDTAAPAASPGEQAAAPPTTAEALRAAAAAIQLAAAALQAAAAPPTATGDAPVPASSTPQ
jgi:hypothetical protein